MYCLLFIQLEEKTSNQQYTRCPKQGHIHNSISHIRVGRGSNAVQIGFWQKFEQRDRHINQLTDRLKINAKLLLFP